MNRAFDLKLSTQENDLAVEAWSREAIALDERKRSTLVGHALNNPELIVLRTMSGGSYSQSKLATLDRRAEAVRLKKEGLTFRAIAERLGCGLSTVHDDVRIMMTATRDEIARDCETIRAVEYERLESIWKRLYEQFISGEVDPKLVVQLHRNSELRSRLLGLEPSARAEAMELLEHEMGEFLVLLQQVLPDDVYSQVQRAVATTAETKGLPTTIEVQVDAV